MSRVLEARVNPEHITPEQQRTPRTVSVGESSDGESHPLQGIARQLFFPGRGVQRRRILLCSADQFAQEFALAEQIARAGVSMNMTVALVDARDAASIQVPKKPPRAEKSGVRRVDYQVSEKLWKLPLATFLQMEGFPDGEKTPMFDRVVFASAISDSSAGLVCSLSDAAVLVVTAGRTHREVALRAAEMLRQFKVDLLGTILTERRFPIPDSIYRRL